jgi:AraC-like DNA-binding protein
MDATFVKDRWSRFRPSTTPTLALPFSLRSLGLYRYAKAGRIEEIRPRSFVQLYWGLSGRTRFTTDAGDVVITTGEIFVYPANVWHRLHALDPGTAYWWFTVDGPLADQAVAAFDLRPPWPKQAGPPPGRLFERLANLIVDPGPTAERAAAALAWELLSIAAAGGHGTTGEDLVVERLRRLLIERSADPELSVSRLAVELGEDRSVLSRRFTRLVGVAPKPFLQSIRLGRAMSLLHTTEAPVSVIARDCGFADPGYFARAFRERTGLTPERFRRG